MIWFDYSIIRYLPNPKRGEIINIGLLIYRASGVDIRMLNASTKLRLVDGMTEYDDVLKAEETLKELASYAESPEEQYNILRTFKTGIFISEKNSFSVENISQYDSRVWQLFNDLVKPFSAASRGPGFSRFQTILKNKFKAMSLLADDISEITKGKIVPNYPIDSGSGLTADFMVKNGKYHMSEVIDFNVNDTKAKFKETTMKVMTFVEGRKNLDDEVKCYFVYSAIPQKMGDVISHLNLAEDYSDQVFNLNSKDEAAKYFELMTDITGHGFKALH